MSTLKQWRDALAGHPASGQYYHFEMLSLLEAGEREVAAERKLREQAQKATDEIAITLTALQADIDHALLESDARQREYTERRVDEMEPEKCLECGNLIDNDEQCNNRMGYCHKGCMSVRLSRLKRGG